jgi:hypothetical protein
VHWFQLLSVVDMVPSFIISISCTPLLFCLIQVYRLSVIPRPDSRSTSTDRSVVAVRQREAALPCLYVLQLPPLSHEAFTD